MGRPLACCDTRFYCGSRNRAMLLVLLDTGVQRTELVNLHLEGRRLRVCQRRGRPVFVANECVLRRASDYDARRAQVVV
jgi:site-specific recombinase XerD